MHFSPSSRYRAFDKIACLRYLITLGRCKLELDVILNLMLLTSKSVAKAISLLIVAMFLFVQIASASHNHHHHEEDTPEPNVCVACLASTQDDDDGDFDIPPPPLTSFKIPNTLDLNLAPLSGATFGLNRIDVNALEPPNLRLSAPRAPPA